MKVVITVEVPDAFGSLADVAKALRQLAGASKPPRCRACNGSGQSFGEKRCDVCGGKGS